MLHWTFVCPICDAGVLWPNAWTDQDETWHASRPRMGTKLPSPKREQSPQFLAPVYCGQTVAHLSYYWPLVEYLHRQIVYCWLVLNFFAYCIKLFGFQAAKMPISVCTRKTLDLCSTVVPTLSPYRVWRMERRCISYSVTQNVHIDTRTLIYCSTL